MRRVCLVAFLLAAPVPAGAVVTWDALHALVLAGQIVPVAAVLQEAVDAARAGKASGPGKRVGRESGWADQPG